MNYYERHIGDYARDTAHLSLLEHGVYTVLLDHLYASENGIPVGSVHRIARARTTEECAAVDSVLADFFTQEDGFYVQSRVQREIDRARVRIETARNNGKKGGRPTQKPKRTRREPKPSIQLTQSKALQTPDTSHQTIPAGLDVAVWERWIEYRKQLGSPLKSASIDAAQRKLAAFGKDQAATVEQSIANGWQGLFALRKTSGPTPTNGGIHDGVVMR